MTDLLGQTLESLERIKEENRRLYDQLVDARREIADKTFRIEQLKQELSPRKLQRTY